MGANPAGWMVAVILLLMGASMVIDPDGFTAFPRNIATGLRNGLRNFELRSQGMLWRDRWQWRGEHLANTSPTRRTAVRAMGLVVIAVGFLAAAVS
jgi:hypothetical protein